jgi:two-component system response regulator HydG
MDEKRSSMSPERHEPTRPRILVVDDDPHMAEMLSEGLADRGYDAVAMRSSQEAARRMADEPFDALVTDLRMPGVDGIELLDVSRKLAPERPVIIMTAFSAIESAVECIRRGAFHYLTKPFKLDELALFLERALDQARLRREATSLRKTLERQFGPSNLLGESASMNEVRDLVARVADASVPVLVVGETGTGKGLVARAIHAESPRAGGRFVTVNCAALPEHLLESELFGHVKGAFTGAMSSRVGLLEEADGGTLFLDEIGEMPLALQAKLLHVLEHGVVRPVGSNRERKIDARVIAATHRDLRAMVAEGTFREDLLYRLDVVTIEIPPLRLRRDDLPLLIEHFLSLSRAKHPRSPVERLAPETLARMLDHAWPGNVRELEHLVERLVLLGRSPEVEASALPSSVGAKATNRHAFGGEVIAMREMQKRYAAWAYEELGGHKTQTAERLGIDVKTLGRLLLQDEPKDD